MFLKMQVRKDFKSRFNIQVQHAFSLSLSWRKGHIYTLPYNTKSWCHMSTHLVLEIDLASTYCDFPISIWADKLQIVNTSIKHKIHI